ncbi:hypothetical protein AYO20_08433 [Fonsecaea nubica]|uniref:Uncharacterized protein n=1 Tax=Fonsecaea nubica TaxID=856822 RepID=A0A178CPN0_9EURO|nr:hypothetical protein AYO20_08433 [Fonsecaea nubica]OAL31102.1 hypothetical protein AYO20_08433 [Fonsecaea nubica]
MVLDLLTEAGRPFSTILFCATASTVSTTITVGSTLITAARNTAVVIAARRKETEPSEARSYEHITARCVPPSEPQRTATVGTCAASVPHLAAKFLARENMLNVLVNNAGIMAVPERRLNSF